MARFEPVLVETFSNVSPHRWDGSGVWSRGPRRGVLVSNSPLSVFLSAEDPGRDGAPMHLDPIRVDDEGLAIAARRIPQDRVEDVDALLARVGQGRFAGQVEYYTGMLATDQSWSQAYGYFEIAARIPLGVGLWPAFWLAPGGVGWPPEIDVFEAYGRAIAGVGPKDHTFNVAVFFDAIDVAGQATHTTDIVNPYAPGPDGAPQAPDVRRLQGGEQFVFNRIIAPLAEHGADIYDAFWTYAVSWDEDAIVFYFGPDRDTLVEIYRTPTPDDLHTPMYVIANNQIGSNWGWNPRPDVIEETLAEDNAFRIASIEIHALRPAERLVGRGPGAVLIGDARPQRIIGTPYDDLIVAGPAQDVIVLRGGSNTVFVERGAHNTIIEGFGLDDRLVLEGFFLDGAQDAHRRLAQVGADVWLMNGGDPAEPQTVLFRERRVEDFVPENFVVRWSVSPDIWAGARHDGTRVRDLDGDGTVVAEPDGSRLSDAGSRFPGTKTLIGSGSGDVYFVYHRDTRIVEIEDGGVDTVYASNDVHLPDHVEVLVSDVERDGLRLTGNAGGNRIVSGPGIEVIDGGGGNNLFDLRAGGGSRLRRGPALGHDTVIGFGPEDHIEIVGIALPSWGALTERLVDLGHDVVLDLGEGRSMTFRDTAQDAFAPSQFLFEHGAMAFVGRGHDPWWRPNALVAASWPAQRSAAMAGHAIQEAQEGETLRGGSGNDILIGAGGATLRGLDGDDLLFGFGDGGILDGGPGSDRIESSGHENRLFGGGGGGNRFVLLPGHSSDAFAADRPDLVMDFAPGDTIDVSVFSAEAWGPEGGPGAIELSQAGTWVDIRFAPRGGPALHLARVRQAAVADVEASLDWRSAP